jgi:hypothetical protein
MRKFIESLVRRDKSKPFLPLNLITWVIILLTVFIAGGGMYDLLDDPPVLFPGPQGSWVAVHPYMSEQTLNESLVSMILTFFMFGGMLAAYKSSQVTYDTKRANTLLIIGITLIVLGFVGSNYLLILKRGVAG